MINNATTNNNINNNETKQLSVKAYIKNKYEQKVLKFSHFSFFFLNKVLSKMFVLHKEPTKTLLNDSQLSKLISN